MSRFAPGTEEAFAATRAQQESRARSGGKHADFFASRTFNPGYWLTQQGQQELRSNAQTQREKQVQQVQGGLDEDGQQILAKYSPLYEAGLMDEQQLGHTVARGVQEAVNQRRDQFANLASIQADAAAIMQLQSPDQMKRATEQLVKKRGAASVLQTPAGQKLLGASEQIDKQRANAMQSFADKFMEGDSRFVTWDDEAGKPVADGEAIRAEMSYKTMQHHADQPRRDALKLLQEATKPMAPRRQDFKSLNGYDDEAFRNASREYYQKQLEFTSAATDPAKLNELLKSQASQATDDPLLGLQPTAREFVTTDPVDPEKVNAAVQLGLATPGWYMDDQGKHVLISRD